MSIAATFGRVVTHDQATTITQETIVATKLELLLHRHIFFTPQQLHDLILSVPNLDLMRTLCVYQPFYNLPMIFALIMGHIPPSLLIILLKHQYKSCFTNTETLSSPESVASWQVTNQTPYIEQHKWIILLIVAHYIPRYSSQQDQQQEQQQQPPSSLTPTSTPLTNNHPQPISIKSLNSQLLQMIMTDLVCEHDNFIINQHPHSQHFAPIIPLSPSNAINVSQSSFNTTNRDLIAVENYTTEISDPILSFDTNPYLFLFNVMCLDEKYITAPTMKTPSQISLQNLNTQYRSFLITISQSLAIELTKRMYCFTPSSKKILPAMQTSDYNSSSSSYLGSDTRSLLEFNHVNLQWFMNNGNDNVFVVKHDKNSLVWFRSTIQNITQPHLLLQQKKSDGEDDLDGDCTKGSAIQSKNNNHKVLDDKKVNGKKKSTGKKEVKAQQSDIIPQNKVPSETQPNEDITKPRISLDDLCDQPQWGWLLSNCHFKKERFGFGPIDFITSKPQPTPTTSKSQSNTTTSTTSRNNKNNNKNNGKDNKKKSLQPSPFTGPWENAYDLSVYETSGTVIDDYGIDIFLSLTFDVDFSSNLDMESNFAPFGTYYDDQNAFKFNCGTKVKGKANQKKNNTWIVGSDNDNHTKDEGHVSKSDSSPSNNKDGLISISSLITKNKAPLYSNLFPIDIVQQPQVPPTINFEPESYYPFSPLFRKSSSLKNLPITTAFALQMAPLYEYPIYNTMSPLVLTIFQTTLSQPPSSNFLNLLALFGLKMKYSPYESSSLYSSQSYAQSKEQKQSSIDPMILFAPFSPMMSFYPIHSDSGSIPISSQVQYRDAIRGSHPLMTVYQDIKGFIIKNHLIDRIKINISSLLIQSDSTSFAQAIITQESNNSKSNSLSPLIGIGLRYSNPKLISLPLLTAPTSASYDYNDAIKALDTAIQLMVLSHLHGLKKDNNNDDVPSTNVLKSNQLTPSMLSHFGQLDDIPLSLIIDMCDQFTQNYINKGWVESSINARPSPFLIFLPIFVILYFTPNDQILSSYTSHHFFDNSIEYVEWEKNQVEVNKDGLNHVGEVNDNNATSTHNDINETALNSTTPSTSSPHSTRGSFSTTSFSSQDSSSQSLVDVILEFNRDDLERFGGDCFQFCSDFAIYPQQFDPKIVQEYNYWTSLTETDPDYDLESINEVKRDFGLETGEHKWFLRKQLVQSTLADVDVLHFFLHNTNAIEITGPHGALLLMELIKRNQIDEVVLNLFVSAMGAHNNDHPDDSSSHSTDVYDTNGHFLPHIGLPKLPLDITDQAFEYTPLVLAMVFHLQYNNFNVFKRMLNNTMLIPHQWITNLFTLRDSIYRFETHSSISNPGSGDKNGFFQDLLSNNSCLMSQILSFFAKNEPNPPTLLNINSALFYTEYAAYSINSIIKPRYRYYTLASTYLYLYFAVTPFDQKIDTQMVKLIAQRQFYSITGLTHPTSDSSDSSDKSSKSNGDPQDDDIDFDLFNSDSITWPMILWLCSHDNLVRNSHNQKWLVEMIIHFLTLFSDNDSVIGSNIMLNSVDNIVNDNKATLIQISQVFSSILSGKHDDDNNSTKLQSTFAKLNQLSHLIPSTTASNQHLKLHQFDIIFTLHLLIDNNFEPQLVTMVLEYLHPSFHHFLYRFYETPPIYIMSHYSSVIYHEDIKLWAWDGGINLNMLVNSLMVPQITSSLSENVSLDVNLITQLLKTLQTPHKIPEILAVYPLNPIDTSTQSGKIHMTSYSMSTNDQAQTQTHPRPAVLFLDVAYRADETNKVEKKAVFSTPLYHHTANNSSSNYFNHEFNHIMPHSQVPTNLVENLKRNVFNAHDQVDVNIIYLYKTLITTPTTVPWYKPTSPISNIMNTMMNLGSNEKDHVAMKYCPMFRDQKQSYIDLHRLNFVTDPWWLEDEVNKYGTACSYSIFEQQYIEDRVARHYPDDWGQSQSYKEIFFQKKIPVTKNETVRSDHRDFLTVSKHVLMPISSSSDSSSNRDIIHDISLTLMDLVIGKGNYIQYLSILNEKTPLVAHISLNHHTPSINLFQSTYFIQLLSILLNDIRTIKCLFGGLDSGVMGEKTVQSILPQQHQQQEESSSSSPSAHNTQKSSKNSGMLSTSTRNTVKNTPKSTPEDDFATLMGKNKPGAKNAIITNTNTTCSSRTVTKQVEDYYQISTPRPCSLSSIQSTPSTQLTSLTEHTLISQVYNLIDTFTKLIGKGSTCRTQRNSFGTESFDGRTAAQLISSIKKIGAHK